MNKKDLKATLDKTFGRLPEDQLLALTIYGEARGETYAGQIAVGSVILERVDHRDWDGKTIKEVCLKPYQFSCFLPNDPNFPKLAAIAKDFTGAMQKSGVLSKCLELARGLISGSVPRDKHVSAYHICQYKTKSCKADWAGEMKLIITIGRHEFYGERK